jgi:hypothetical protein
VAATRTALRTLWKRRRRAQAAQRLETRGVGKLLRDGRRSFAWRWQPFGRS